jgi:hypothetical protein
VFIDLPLLSGNGLATVNLIFTTLPPGVTWHTFVLYELPPSGPAFPVPPCDGSQLPAGADSCIPSNGQQEYSPFGAQITLLVLGTGTDPRYAG